MRFALLLFLLLKVSPAVLGQDTLLFLNGKSMHADSISFNGHTVQLISRTGKRQHAINPYRVFSIRHTSGEIQMVYTPDPSDPMDLNEEQMGLFIKGEQDANKYYKNNINKAAAFAVGAGSSFFTIYGLIIPPLYATAVGAFTPKMNLSDLSDSPYINNTYYCEGYQKKMRDRKIRNALVSGLAGFAAGFITLTLVK